MERLYEQMRAKYSNSEKKDREPNYTREGEVPPKKAVSFKEEKKVSWFPRQFSGQMSQFGEPSDSDFATAVAAATYAISSLEEGSLNKQMTVDRVPTFSNKTKSKKESAILKITESGRISRWFSGKEAKEDRGSAGEISMRRSEERDRKILEDQSVRQSKPGKGLVTVPSIKKPLASMGKYLNDTGSKRLAGDNEKVTGKTASFTKKPPISRTGSGSLNLTNSGDTDTKADAWEKAEMEKIQKRYEKMYSSIIEWENEKKGKAKQKLEQRKGELERKRRRGLEEYNEEIARIEKIAAGARAVADDKKTKDERKMMEMANEIRSTGKISHYCFCF